MSRNVVNRLPITVAIVVACLGALVCATSVCQAWTSPEAACSGPQCVVVRSAPAVATCRIVSPAPTATKASAAPHQKTTKTRTAAVKSKSSKTVKAAAQKKGRSTAAAKRASSTAHRSSRATR